MSLSDTQKKDIVDLCLKGELYLHPEYIKGILDMLDLTKWMDQLESMSEGSRQSSFYTKEKLVTDLLHTYEFCIHDSAMLLKETKMAMLTTMFSAANYSENAFMFENKAKARNTMLAAAKKITDLFPGDPLCEPDVVKKIMTSMGHIWPDSPASASKNPISAIVRDVRICHIYSDNTEKRFDKYDLMYSTSNNWDNFEAWKTYFFGNYAGYQWETRWGKKKAWNLNFPAKCREFLNYVEEKYKDTK